jgi:hypothetical protein
MKTREALGELTGQSSTLGFSDPKVAEHFRRVAEAQERERDQRAQAVPVSAHLVALGQRVAAQQNQVLDQSMPVIDKFSAYKTASGTKAATPALRNFQHRLKTAWLADELGSYTARDLHQMAEFYKAQFGKTAEPVLNIIRDGFAHNSYAQLPVRKLANLASAIHTQEEFDYAMRRAGLDGNRPDQVKARRFILALLNREAQADEFLQQMQADDEGAEQMEDAAINLLTDAQDMEKESASCADCQGSGCANCQPEGAPPTGSDVLVGVDASDDTGLNVPVTMQLENFGGEQAPPFDAQDAAEARKKREGQPGMAPVQPGMAPVQPVQAPPMLTARRRAAEEPGKANYEPAIEGQQDDAVKVNVCLDKVTAGQVVRHNGYSLHADFGTDELVITTPSGATRRGHIVAMRKIATDFVRVSQKSPNFNPKVNAQQPGKVKLPGGGGAVLGDDSGSDPKLDGEFEVSVSKKPKDKVSVEKTPGPDTQSDGLQHFNVSNRGPHTNIPKGKMSDKDIWGDTQQDGLNLFDIKINEPRSK